MSEFERDRSIGLEEGSWIFWAIARYLVEAMRQLDNAGKSGTTTADIRFKTAVADLVRQHGEKGVCQGSCHRPDLALLIIQRAVCTHVSNMIRERNLRTLSYAVYLSSLYTIKSEYSGTTFDKHGTTLIGDL